MDSIKPCKSPLGWVGGKHYISSWIISHFPEHKVYVEPFGGGAHVLCNKDPGISQLEVYNDTYDEVVNFFRTLQDKDMFRELLYKLRNSPYSREYFYQVRDSKPTGTIDKVYRWLYLMKCCFAGNMQNRKPSWGYSKNCNRQIKRYNNFPKRMISLRNRFKQVQIEKLDFREVIKKYDSPNTLFYCDPPYVNVEHYYEGGFGLKDHEDLAHMLNNIKGKAIVSYYPGELVSELYPGWRVEEKQTNKSSCRVNKGEAKPKSTEILLMNFPAAADNQITMFSEGE